MNVIQTLKKILTPAGSNIYPGDLLFATRRMGFILRKFRVGGKFYFQIRWTGAMEQLIDEFSGLEVREHIEAGDWYYSPIITKETPEKIR
jgi:hypothetical protein